MIKVICSCDLADMAPQPGSALGLVLTQVPPQQPIQRFKSQEWVKPFQQRLLNYWLP